MKGDLNAATEIFLSLFEEIWEEEKLHDDRKEGLIIKLPKKGDLRDCKTYRGVMLLSVPGKVLNRFLLERMKRAVDSVITRQVSDRTGHVLTTSSHHASLSSSPWSGTIHSMPASLTMRRPVIANTGKPSGNSLVTMLDHLTNTVQLSRNVFQSCAPRTAFRSLQGQVWGASGISAVAFPLHTCGRLDQENFYRRKSSGHCGHSLTTFILPMTWHSCPTAMHRCRTILHAWIQHQQD